MDYGTLLYIRSNPNISKYIRENSYWYKYLIRDNNSIKVLENEMKDKYHLRTEDKLEEFNKKLEMITEVINILR